VAEQGPRRKGGVERVREAVAAAGLATHVREMPDSTRTAPEAAAAVGCDVAQIVKSLVFRGATSGRPLLALVSGRNRASEAKLETLFGEPLGRADADFVRERTGFAVGGVPPLGHAEALATVVDQDLLAFPVVWAAAGSPRAVFDIAPADLVRVTRGRVADVAA
jgi:prolyl-tRNA editing enzyme YbaK/EbsC (Cys-tRNA(Pro) deacylase)